MNLAKLTLLIILTFSTFRTIEATESFPQTLKSNVLDCIKMDTQLENIQNLDIEKINTYITTLCDQGYAEVTGTDQECRAVCVIAQGAIEQTLAKMLRSGELFLVTSFFLTPLPTTPFRKNGVTDHLSSVYFEPARQYTLDMREHTLRALREAGSLILAAYSQEAYDTLVENQDSGSQEQVRTWEIERQHPFVCDIPLNKDIPEELIGALYIIADQSGKMYYLPVQAIQAQNASEGTAVWKKWLCRTSDDELEGTIHALQMLKFMH